MHSGRREKATEKVSCFGDFLSPVAKTPLSMQGARVQSLVRELDPTCHSQDPSQLDKLKFLKKVFGIKSITF